MRSRPAYALDIDGCLIDFANECFVPAMNEVCGLDRTPDYHPDQWRFNPGLCTADQENATWKSDEIIERMRAALPLAHALDLYCELGSDAVLITSGSLAVRNQASSLHSSPVGHRRLHVRIH